MVKGLGVLEGFFWNKGDCGCVVDLVVRWLVFFIL